LPASPRQVGQLPGFSCAARRRRCQVPVRGAGLPAPYTFPGSPPRWCPFPTVKAFLLPPRMPRKSLRSIISSFSAIHKESTESMQLFPPYGGYPPAYSQPVHKLPGVTRGTQSPAVPRVIGSSFLSVFRVIIWCLELDDEAQAAWAWLPIPPGSSRSELSAPCPGCGDTHGLASEAATAVHWPPRQG
jgi:hypothetical protein